MKIIILKYLLTWFKERILSRQYTNDQSSVVDSIDYLIERLNHGKI
ncbi:MAG: hypothetical protein ACUZ8H_05160 [Candidatus Anammoxibacter sp.]